MEHLMLLLLTVTVTAIAAIDVDDFPYLRPSQLQTVTSEEVQRKAAQDAICHFTLNRCDRFRVAVIDHALLKDEKDTFTLWTSEVQGAHTLNINASSGVAAVWGFNYYLKEFADMHVGWQVRNIDVQNVYPKFFIKLTVEASDRFRYYQNVCTASYSFVWWSAEEWRNHIYWMALNGINLSLAPLGQENVWRRVYRQLGLTEDEIQEHFTGPAFLSWLRMGNLRGWGGPLPENWYENAPLIQDKILKTMRDLGMVPVLPAFAGHVPRAFARVFPNASLHAIETWNSFSDDYCCPLFVDPGDPLFRRVGELYLLESARDDGFTHVYNADPFNELRMNLGVWSDKFVKSVGEAVFSSMSAVDPKAVWLLQNWMFVHDSDLWPRDRVREFLQSVPRGRALILDLQSEQWPQYYNYDMYFGQPFVWCMLHNFGGTLGMFGNVKAISTDVYVVRKHSNSTMLGVGLTMEGINQNYVLYDLMLESAWRPSPVDNLDEWTAAYAQRRYGRVCGNATARGWRYLLRSVYSFRGLNRMRGKYAVTRRPSLGIKPWAWYKSHDLLEAWREFAHASTASACYGGNEAFEHDLVDVTRQALQYRAEQLYLRVVDMLRSDSNWAARRAIDDFLDVLKDMEAILSTRAEFSLWSWLRAAHMAADYPDTDIYQMNARNQITLWGPNGEISDYACKQWAGMFQHYYIPRWRLFLEAAYEAMVKGVKFNEKHTQQEVCTAVERSFAIAEVTPVNSSGDASCTLARLLVMKWFVVPEVEDLPQNVLYPEEGRGMTLADTDDDNLTAEPAPSVRLQRSTTPL